MARRDADRLDTVLRLVSDRNRRAVMRYFRDAPGDTASFETVCDHLASVDEADLGPDRVAIAVHHWILPKLEAAGVVEYDVRSETVRYRGHPVVDDLLDRLDR